VHNAVSRPCALAVVLAVLLLPILAGSVAAASPKTTVCHYDREAGGFKPISVASSLKPKKPDYVADTALTGRAVYAIAYTNVNGVAGYQPEACDVFISALVEASGNTVPDAGDEVLYGMSPTAFSAPYGFVAFPSTSRVVLDATCDRATFDAAGDFFVRWRSLPAFEDLVVATEALVVIIRDDITGDLEDSIFVSTTSVSVQRSQPRDDAFLEFGSSCAA
jgi:hypothetical protein